MSEVAENLATIRRRIAEACARAGRSPDDVRLMAASKRQPWDRITDAIAAGVRLFGENRVQEVVEKHHLFDGCELHLIGHLQRNKVRDVAPLVSCVQSIDAERTAAALARQVAPLRRTMTVYLEVNTSGEPAKYGVAGRDELRALADAIARFPELDIGGLMTVGPLTDDERRGRAAFAELRRLSETLADHLGVRRALELSMGMSGDMEAAILEGSTMIRVGTALFGERPA